MRRRISVSVVLLWTIVFANDSNAEPVDCEKIRTSLIPFEIKLRKEAPNWKAPQTIQVARNASGMDTTSIKFKSPFGSYTQKSTGINGALMVSDRQYVRGEYIYPPQHSTIEYAYWDPMLADPRADADFVMRPRVNEADGKLREDPKDVTFTFQKTEEISINPCKFIAHRGKAKITDQKTGNEEIIYSWHFPDLRLRIGHSTQDVTFEGISTSFEPIELAEPNWPPK